MAWPILAHVCYRYLTTHAYIRGSVSLTSTCALTCSSMRACVRACVVSTCSAVCRVCYSTHISVTYEYNIIVIGELINRGVNPERWSSESSFFPIDRNMYGSEWLTCCTCSLDD